MLLRLSVIWEQLDIAKFPMSFVVTLIVFEAEVILVSGTGLPLFGSNTTTAKPKKLHYFFMVFNVKQNQILDCNLKKTTWASSPG